MSKYRIWMQIEEENDEGDFVNSAEEESTGPFASQEAAQEAMIAAQTAAERHVK